MLLPPQHNNIKGLESIKLHLSTVRTGAIGKRRRGQDKSERLLEVVPAPEANSVLFLPCRSHN